MNHEIWLERADVYALGALDEAERVEFEHHLATGCVECARRLRDAADAVSLLAHALPAQTPAPATKRRLLNAISREASASPARHGVTWSRVAATVGALAACGLLSYMLWENQGTNQRLRERDAEVNTLRADIARRKEIYRLLEDSEVTTIALVGQGPSPAATGRLLRRPAGSSGVLITKGLPEAPADKRYALWAIDPTGPTLAGTFRVDRMGRAQVSVSNLPAPGALQRFEVTLESSINAASAPTGPAYLLGAVASVNPT